MRTHSKWFSAFISLMVFGTAAVAVAQPGWNRRRLNQNELLRVQHFTAPYQGFYCVRTVHTDGRITAWREVPGRGHQGTVRGRLSLPGLAALQGSLAVLPAGPPPPPTTPDGHTRMRLMFQSPGGVQVREYSGVVPLPVLAVVGMVDGALTGAPPGCEL